MSKVCGFIRTHVFPVVAQFALQFDWVKQTVFPLVSQIGINYRASDLSCHAGDAHFKIKAGDRMPYFLIDDKSIFDFLREPKFHFLVFSGEQTGFKKLFQTVGKYDEWIDCQSFPLAPRVAEIFGANKPFSLLLRPDNHIAFITEGFFSPSAAGKIAL